MGAAHLTLASASPRRRELLGRLGLAPDAVLPADIDETPLKGELPRAYALRMGREKALAVDAPGFVLAGDTVVAVGRRILPKTETEAEARACLELMSGRRHQVLSSVVLRGPDGALRERLDETVVSFKRLSTEEITAYLAGGEWQGKAGGYAIQGADRVDQGQPFGRDGPAALSCSGAAQGSRLPNWLSG
jgi:septum formation protein